MRPANVPFTVTAVLDRDGRLTCAWECNECGQAMTAGAVRAHVIAHANETKAVAS